jgi:hypothetical protein
MKSSIYGLICAIRYHRFYQEVATNGLFPTSSKWMQNDFVRITPYLTKLTFAKL